MAERSRKPCCNWRKDSPDTMTVASAVWQCRCGEPRQAEASAGMDASMNLYQARNHSVLRILLVSDDWRTRQSLHQLGFHAGDAVHVIRRAPFGGPLVIESRNSRVAIGKQLAERIRVEVLP